MTNLSRCIMEGLSMNSMIYYHASSQFGAQNIIIGSSLQKTVEMKTIRSWGPFRWFKVKVGLRLGPSMWFSWQKWWFKVGVPEGFCFHGDFSCNCQDTSAASGVRPRKGCVCTSDISGVWMAEKWLTLTARVWNKTLYIYIYKICENGAGICIYICIYCV